ncbi:MAG: recombination-associated protein RdgC [Planctomycetota bacterium]
MLVGKGSLTFRQYEIGGKRKRVDPDYVCERLSTFAFAGLASGEEGVAQGWVAPAHLFDGDFDRHRLFHGPYVTFALRIDTRKVPASLINAHAALEINAALEAEGLDRLSNRRKREIKEEIRLRLAEETPPTQKAFGVFWNLEKRRVYLQNTSKTVNEAFRALFERTFETEISPQIPGLQAAGWARAAGLLETLREARPLELRAAPAGSSAPSMVRS